MTPANLYAATARELHVLADGQALGAEAQAKIAAKYVSLHAMLLNDGLVTWAITEEVPPKAEQPVIFLLAALCVGVFGIGEPRKGFLMAQGAYGNKPPSLAERQLRRALSSPVISQPVPAEYF